MTLVLEIEYLTGVVFAAQGPDSETPDWPPQPDRVFSALVATWGARGEQAREAEALKWLEKQSVPLIVASKTEPRTAPAVYVPPNDFETMKNSGLPRVDSRPFDRAIGVIPSLRQTRERIFPASRPHDPVVRLYWEAITPDENAFEALTWLAADTAYVGHSASLTRCRFLYNDALPTAESQSSTRRVYEGRFDELRRDYERFAHSSGKIGRPHLGDRVAPLPQTLDETPYSNFSPDWLVLEHAGGEMPDVRAAALLSKEIRDALLSGYRQCGMGDRIPSLVSGHMQDGGPVQAPHLAIVPLTFAGYPYAEGQLLGFALVPPRGSDLFRDPIFLKAMRKIAPLEEGRRSLQWSEAKETMRLRSFGLKLSPTIDPSKSSLAPDLYTKKACTFATVTPIALDRHLKKNGSERQNEIAHQIKLACKNIGLPEPNVVVPDKHSAMEGAPSAQPSGNAPNWMRWRLPVSLIGRLLTHAIIQFSSPVKGPVILGSGRFVGLGLCRPIADEENRG